jgi:hypothetical protein
MRKHKLNTRDGLRTGSLKKFNDENKYNTALRAVFQRQETNKLTEQALEVCRIIQVNPEDLCHKSLDSFMKENGVKVNSEIAEVRFRHY